MNQLEQEQLLQRPPLAPRCHGGERERERSRPAICRKNYRPGLIKLFDRLEADTEGRKEGGPRLGIILRQRRRPSNLVLEGADTHTYYILQTFRVGSAGGGRMGGGNPTSLPHPIGNNSSLFWDRTSLYHAPRHPVRY